jgi:uncharacterized heparinase superfamily protein
LPSAAQASGYARLERGDTTIVVDVGSPPPLEMATEAQAGALSFEMSSRQYLVLANGGFPGPADQSWVSAARATASHNTLALAETSSSRLVRHPQLEAMIGGMPIKGPDNVFSASGEKDGQIFIDTSHDGYLKRFGLIHSRRLSLSADGNTLEGVDALRPPKGQLRLKTDLPYAIHFHLHPDCRCTLDEPSLCRVKLPDGRIWMFSAKGSTLTIEESIFYVDSAGPRPSLQIVLRGTTFGETDVHWSMRCEPDMLG